MTQKLIFTGRQAMPVRHPDNLKLNGRYGFGITNHRCYTLTYHHKSFFDVSAKANTFSKLRPLNFNIFWKFLRCFLRL